MRHSIPVAALALLTGCSALAPVNAFTPPVGYRATRGVAYGAEARQRLDVYVPKAPAVTPAPVVVFFYGGAWQYGSRRDYRFAGQALASRGFVAVVPDYRLYPEVRFPVFVEDGARAVAWTRAAIAGHGGDPARIFLMGHSAGAHIAALLALDPSFLARAGAPRGPWLAGFIGLAGPYDFLPIRDPVTRVIFGPPAVHPRGQPIEFATGDDPPMLLLHGAEDETVLVRNSLNLARDVRTRGGDAETIVYAHWGHRRVLLALAAPLRWLGPVLDDVTHFIARVSGGAPAPPAAG